MKVDQIKSRVDAFQLGHRPVAFLCGVIKKFGQDQSGNLAVLITYYLFFSIFPLLIALASILGFVLGSNSHWYDKVHNTVLTDFPFFNGKLPQHGSVALVVIGVALAIYSGLGVAKAAQQAWDIVYRVPVEDRPGFVPKNLLALRVVAVGGLSLIVTTVASSTVASAGAIGIHIGPAVSVLGYLVTLLVNTAMFTLVFRWLTVRKLSFRDVLPGAAFFAVTLAILQSLSSFFISHKAAGASTYGTFGTVIILLSWFYLQCQALLFAAQINVVRLDRLWPISLFEPADEVLI